MTCLCSNHIILYSNINRLFTLSIAGAYKETASEWLMGNLTNYFLLCFKWVDNFLLAIIKGQEKPELLSLFRMHFFQRDILSHKIFIHILQF